MNNHLHRNVLSRVEPNNDELFSGLIQLIGIVVGMSAIAMCLAELLR